MLCQRKVSLLLLSSDIRQTEAKRLAQLAGEEMKKDEKSTQKNGYDQNWHFEYEIMAVFIIINIITINLLGFFLNGPANCSRWCSFTQTWTLLPDKSCRKRSKRSWLCRRL